ncbi:hypothetical protein PTH_0174 [Pelotomaculum thermopropionicum SI]|uniref:Uncharacterized protein n=1 Tax=Pelotomaculum thermopropionicum (strain DSM 13744 / JCM 10971 / SI) TaxID=370438 RepID=A5D5Z0_PELTS|nr:hypothetical protein PTH_0174 [Pelotomaculum thermopropionicum SI]
MGKVELSETAIGFPREAGHHVKPGFTWPSGGKTANQVCRKPPHRLDVENCKRPGLLQQFKNPGGTTVPACDLGRVLKEIFLSERKGVRPQRFKGTGVAA